MIAVNTSTYPLVFGRYFVIATVLTPSSLQSAVKVSELKWDWLSVKAVNCIPKFAPEGSTKLFKILFPSLYLSL